VPTAAPLEDGDYLAADGTMSRVINGKIYELVQYRTTNPQLLPGWDAGTPSTSSPSNPVPQTPTQIQLTTDYRTATRMTQDFGNVAIPTYENLLGQQESYAQIAPQGVVTVTVPVQATIVPETTPVETVPSLDYSQYSEIGTITAPSSISSIPSTGSSATADDEIQRSIWGIMASQNNDYLLYNAKNQSELEKSNLPTYLPLSNPTPASLPGTSINPGTSRGGTIFSETSPYLVPCPPRTVYQRY
jgi:hypothetical protein